MKFPSDKSSLNHSMYRDFARTSNRLKGEKDVSGFERSSEGIGVFQMVDPGHQFE